MAEKLQAVGAASPTCAMDAAYEQRGCDINEYLKRLPRQTGQTGVVAAVAGQVMCADLFDRPETLEGLWDRLIPSYAMEAPAMGGGGKVEDAKVADAVDPRQIEAASAFLQSARDATVTTHSAVGRGTDMRITGRGVVGAALEAEGAVLHLSLFRIESRGSEWRARRAGFASAGERRGSTRRRTGR